MDSSNTSRNGEIETTKNDNVYKGLPQSAFNIDIEQKVVDDCHLLNDTVRNFVWRGVKVVVKDRKTKQPKTILEDVAGVVEAGESQLLRSSLEYMLIPQR
jgi:hypothetical protein